MVNINSNELEQYKKIGSGTFGTIYKVNDELAYKVYHKEIFNSYHELRNNPMLFKRNYKVNKIIKYQNKIKYTDLVLDSLFIDNRFKGVVIPYYDGLLLSNLLSLPLKDKLKITKELLRNAMELTTNNIYPLDYKLNNIIYTNDKVKIIDLDDLSTKYTYLLKVFFKDESINALYETIRIFIGDVYNLHYSNNITNLLNKYEKRYAKTYDEINKYLDFKDVKRNIVFIDFIPNDELVGMLKNKSIDVIYIYYDNKYDDNYFLNIIEQFRKLNIKLFDIVCVKDFNKYLNCTNVNSKRLIKKGSN